MGVRGVASEREGDGCIPILPRQSTEEIINTSEIAPKIQRQYDKACLTEVENNASQR